MVLNTLAKISCRFGSCYVSLCIFLPQVEPLYMCCGQFLKNQSTHKNREVDVIKSQKKPIANTVKICANSKGKKSHTQIKRIFTMSMTITIESLNSCERDSLSLEEISYLYKSWSPAKFEYLNSLS